MKFVELEKKSGFLYDGLRLNEKYISLSSSLCKKMGTPDSATVFFDVDEAAIGLKVGGENARRLITSSKRGIVARLPDGMPRGRYLFKEEKDGLFICKRRN